MNILSMKGRLSRAILWICLSCSLFATSVCMGQDDSSAKSKSVIVAFVDNIAQATYKLAWPTATYRRYEIISIMPKESGYDVVVEFDGTSAFDDSDLWLKLGFKFRDGDLTKIWIVDHNALLMPPFGTVGTVAVMTAQYAKKYAASSGRQHPAPAASGEAGAICLINSMPSPVVFAFRWGNGPWEQGKIEASSVRLYWWPYQPSEEDASPNFEIRYDDSFEEGYTEQAYLLDRRPSVLPVTCEAAKQYRFTNKGPKIFLTSMN